MVREFRLLCSLCVLTVGAHACATSPDVGGESHFFCSRDRDCPAAAPTCVSHSCREIPASAGGSPAGTGGASPFAEGLIGNGGASSTERSDGGGAPGLAGGRGATEGGAGQVGASDAGQADAADAADAACVVLDAGIPSPPPDGYSCSQLDALVLEHPVLMDESGDGVLSPGERATLTVTMREVAGVGAYLYPGVLFSLSSDAGIGVEANNYRYAALPCTAVPMSGVLSVSADVPLHTRFVVHAKLDAINSGGCPNGDVLDVPVSVGDPLP